MSTEERTLPSRRDFVRRVGQTAAFATPLMFALGGSPAAAGESSPYERAKTNLTQATKLIATARRDVANLEARQRSELQATVRTLREEFGRLNRYF